MDPDSKQSRFLQRDPATGGGSDGSRLHLSPAFVHGESVTHLYSTEPRTIRRKSIRHWTCSFLTWLWPCIRTPAGTNASRSRVAGRSRVPAASVNLRNCSVITRHDFLKFSTAASGGPVPECEGPVQARALISSFITTVLEPAHCVGAAGREKQRPSFVSLKPRRYA